MLAALAGILVIVISLIPAQQTHAAVFNPLNTAQLIAAINTANGNGQADTINLVAGFTYDLTVIDNGIEGNNGLPSILPDGGFSLTINGNGATIRRGDGTWTCPGVANPDFRIFHVAAGSDLTLNNVTVSDGCVQGTGVAASGGGIFNRGTLTVTNSTITDNMARGNDVNCVAPCTGDDGNGGGIYSTGTLNIDNSTISNNTARGGDGNCITANCTGGVGNGGGIYNTGTLNSTGNTINDNDAQGGDANGIAFIRTSGAGNGGALYNDGGVAFLDNDQLTVNNALYGDCAPVAPAVLCANHFGGGAVHNNGGSVTLTESTLSDNYSDDDGGAVYNANVGGALVSIIRSTLSTNNAHDDGGAICSDGGPITVVNSTISGNSSDQDGGGIYTQGATTVENSTIYLNNSASQGDSIYNTSIFNIYSSIVASGAGNDCAGAAVINNGYNIASDATCGTILAAGPTPAAAISNLALGSLTNSGGPTETHLPAPISVVIDQGDCGGSIPVATDQRGVVRPIDDIFIPDAPGGDGCDIGAVEFEAVPPLVQFQLAASSVNENPGGPFQVSVILIVTVPVPAGIPNITATVIDTGLGSATSGSDYAVFPPQIVTFVVPPGGLAPGIYTEFVTLNIIYDPAVELDETVVLNITGATGALLGTILNHTVTIIDDDVETDTPTPSNTPTHTPTPSNTPTHTPTSSDTPTRTPTPSDTPTRIPTTEDTPTSTRTSTPTGTATSTATETGTATQTATGTATQTATSTATQTTTSTATRTATGTATRTATGTATRTATGTATRTATGTATRTATGTATRTVTGTVTATQIALDSLDDSVLELTPTLLRDVDDSFPVEALPTEIRYISSQAIGTICVESGGFANCVPGDLPGIGVPGQSGGTGFAPGVVSVDAPYIIKVGDPPVAGPGTEVAYIIRVINPTSTVAQNVRVEDVMPDAVEILGAESSSGSLSIDGQNITFTQSQLAVGGRITITLFTRIKEEGDFSQIINRACLTSTSNVSPSCAEMGFTRVSILPGTGEAPFNYWIVRVLVPILLASSAVILWCRRRKRLV